MGFGFMFATRSAWAKYFGAGTMLERGHLVDEAGVGGGVAGAKPPHKGGRLRPTAQNAVVSGWRDVWGKLGGGNGGRNGGGA